MPAMLQLNISDQQTRFASKSIRGPALKYNKYLRLQWLQVYR